MIEKQPMPKQVMADHKLHAEPPMPRVIYKFALNPGGRTVLDLPSGARLLFIECQREVPCVWVETPSRRISEVSPRTILSFATGEVFKYPPEQLHYLGSVLQHQGSLVWHFYELFPSGMKATDNAKEEF